MAVASTPTLLPLDRFSEILGVNPLHFNQMDMPQDLELSNCGMPILQQSWQSQDAISREEIATAIADAEQELEKWLHYPPLPKWFDEHVMLPQRAGIITSGRVQPSQRLFISGGIRGTTLIQEESFISYSDADNDGFEETATITVALPLGVSADEVAIFYPGQAAAVEWQIRPVLVTVAAGVATITCKRWQLVKPELLSPLAPSAVNPTDSANFLDAVDVYRVYNDPSQQVEFHIRNQGCGVCSGGGCVACGYTVEEGCIAAIDYRLAHLDLTHAAWNADTALWQTGCCPDGAPERARIKYLAGLTGPRGSHTKMSLDMELAVARLAITKLDRQFCGCQSIQHAIQYWTEDLASRVSTAGKSISTSVPQLLRNCPWGTKRGALYAYSIVLTERLP